MPVKTKCPGCGKETLWKGNIWRPFCSERCKMADLGAWITEGYKIPDESWEDSGHDEAPRDEEEDR